VGRRDPSRTGRVAAWPLQSDRSPRAPCDVVDALENIDEDDYANVTDVTKALGRLND